MNTLVIHTGGIGDLILACPAIARLAAEGPVHLAGYSERLALAVEAGIAVDAADLEAIDFASVFTEPSRRLAAALAPFDRAVVWMRDDDGRIAGAMRHCGVDRVDVFPGLPPKDWSCHASIYYLDCLGFEEAVPNPLRFEPAKVDLDVLIHAGSGGRSKNWPMNRFADVAERLGARGRKVAWISGPAEEEMAFSPLAARLEAMPLTRLARHLAAAQLYIGNDSGITHLAAAAGCPTVAVFGPTDPRVWGPLGRRVRIVAGQPWPSVDEVLSTVLAPWDK